MQLADPYIMIADDDPEDRQVFSDEFAHQNPGIIVKQVESGRELLHYLNERPAHQLPAVIVLDYQMPDLNGPHILQHLAANARYSQIVKVMWSTSRRAKDMEECKRLGATHYFFKPDTINELGKVIHQVTAIFERVSIYRQE